ncbi:hypothetical protein UPYG_G00146980 [Umbra pygmaea]|uniref:Ig-like domain-containing protein n=1 Tax=Umbra pygmaea TaxID=75934 RepID=A0ABD0XCP4_UMBPY
MEKILTDDQKLNTDSFKSQSRLIQKIMYMKGSERVFLLGCLLQGILCQDWIASVPQYIEVLSGLCVVIPCSFTLETNYEALLTASCKGIWRKGWRGTHVFDSSLTGTGLNAISGNLTGNLQQKECTTVLNDFKYYFNDYVTFRLECDNELKYNYPQRVEIETKEYPSNPTLSPATVDVMEGTSVSLVCSAAATCPTLPPTLTWTPTLTDSVQYFPESQNQVLTSAMNFTASHVHHGEEITCTALYKRQAGKSDKSSKTSLIITVLYSPKNTSVSVSPSSSVVQGHSVTLTCTSNANPSIDQYKWYRVIGEQVTSVGDRSMLTVQVPADDSYFYCEAINDHGTQNSSVIQLDGMYPPMNTSVSVSPSGPLIEGSSVMLSCSSKANPAVKNFTWYRVNGTEGVAVGSGKCLILDSKASDSGEYYCEALHALGMEKATVIQLDIQYPPKNTSVSVSPSHSVAEGSSVMLGCSTTANPAVKNFTWYRVVGWQKEIVGSEEDLNIFNLTRHSNDLFYCEAKNVHGLQNSEAISINVTYASEILNSSHCIRISATSQIRCFCESQGNPSPTLTWQLAGEIVNHSSNTDIREEPMSRGGLRSSLTFRQLQEEELPTLLCLSANSDGYDSFLFNLTSIETYEGFHLFSLLIGAGVGAAVMMLLCIPLLLICKHRRVRQPAIIDQGETAELRLAHSQEDSVYANTAMLNEALVADGTDDGDFEDTDQLHYADLNFSKIQGSVAEHAEGEVRGVASKTSEYAMIRLQSTGSIGEEAGEGEGDSALKQEDHTEDHEAEAVEGNMTGPQSRGDELRVPEPAVDEVTLLSKQIDVSNGDEEEVTYGNI